MDESSHKGLGRLVYLCYFDEIFIESIFSESEKRSFTFSQQFEDEKFTIDKVANIGTGTVLSMKGYTLQKIAKLEYISPKEIKKRILEEFYSRLFQLKKEKRKVQINIKSKIDNKETVETLSNDEIPRFEFVEIESGLNLIDKFQLYYSIEQVEVNETSLISAISVDNRTFKVDLIADENIPTGYKMIFSEIEFIKCLCLKLVEALKAKS